MQLPTERKSEQPRSEWAVWFAVLGPPLIWLTQFQVKYALAARTSFEARSATVGASLVAMVAVGACALVAARCHRRADASPLDVYARKGPRIRFMGLLGLMTSGLFFLLVVAQLLADVFIDAGRQ